MIVTETGEFGEALVARVAAARLRLAEAAASANLPEVAAALDELEEVHGLAIEAGIAIPRPSTTVEETEQ